jgi:hypothetical protein
MKKQVKKQSVNERLKDTVLEMAAVLYKHGDIDAAKMREYEALTRVWPFCRSSDQKINPPLRSFFVQFPV